MNEILTATNILSHWRTLEFLTQESLPIENQSRLEERQLILRGLDTVEGDNVYNELQGLKTSWGTLTFYVGMVKREACVTWLEKHLTEQAVQEENRPETAEGELAWFSLQTDKDGNYIANTFSLSPIVWVISRLKSDSTKGEEVLDADAYEQDVIGHERNLQQIWNDIASHGIENDPIGRKLGFRKDDELDEQWKHFQVLNGYLRQWVQAFSDDFLPVDLSQDSLTAQALVVYADANKPATKDNYKGLSNSFYVNDLNLVLNYIEQHKDAFDGSKAQYGMCNVLMNYLLSPIIAEQKRVEDGEFDVVNGNGNTKEEREQSLQTFISEVLDIRRYPMGKWPSKFEPALMQQVAINMASFAAGHTALCEREGRFGANGPIFTVNGPPGTGKTTLLKEVIANNIVERAKLLADNYSNPDEAFEECKFVDGDKADNGYSASYPHYYRLRDVGINQYGILVASCNNAAVENITKETPDLKKLADDAADEIKKLFAGEQAKVYFTKYATELLNVDHGGKATDSKENKVPQKQAWGLIAAPLGKKENIYDFDTHVLKKICYRMDHTTREDLNKYRAFYCKRRKVFLEQYAEVNRLRKLLGEACDLRKNADIGLFLQANLSKCKDELQTVEQECEKLRLKIKQCKDNQKIFKPKSGGLLSVFHRKTEEEKEKEQKFHSLQNKEKDLQDKLFERIQASEKIQVIVSDMEKKVALGQESEKELIAFCQQQDEKFIPLSEQFILDMLSSDEVISGKAQTASLWVTPEYNRAREKLFYEAMRYMEDFVLSSKALRANFENLRIYWGFQKEGGRISESDKITSFPALLQSLFLLVPVVSTTFASAEHFLKDAREAKSLGMLVVDESGQASPQMAVGSLLRASSAMIVGDPRQIEPVVTDELKLIRDALFEKYPAYRQKDISVQSFADQLNRCGTVLKVNGDVSWVGSPLRVHRRCISPMYDMSNRLSYGGFMRNQTCLPEEEKVAAFFDTINCSAWFDVTGKEKGGKNHFVEAQADIALEIVQKHFATRKDNKLYIISPFKSVASSMEKYISTHYPTAGEWAKANIGTVHTFQGKEAEEVIFLLGCDEDAKGAVRWVNSNIVNVAATRAKFRFYIIGDWSLWQANDNLKLVQEILEEKHLPHISQKTLNTDNVADLSSESKEFFLLSDCSSTSNSVADKAESPAKKTTQEVQNQGTAPVCPRCKMGTLVQRTNSKTGTKFWGCSRFPKCKYTCNKL